MNASDNPEEIGDSCRISAPRRRLARIPIPLRSAPIRKFSDASFISSDSEASKSSSPSGSEGTISSDSESEESKGSVSITSSSEEGASDHNGRSWRQSTTVGQKNPASTGASKRRCFTKRRQHTRRKLRTGENRRQDIDDDDEDRDDRLESSLNKFHYRNYHTHFHRRATFEKFSLIKVLRYWVVTMSQFTSKYHKEIFLVFFCIVSGLASLRTGPLKTKTVPSPGPFFTDEERGDLIQDFYRGEYVDLSRKQIPYHPAFILYYAHWDAESVESKRELLAVAKYFHASRPGLVKFYAVNCWWPDGQCRQNYKSLSHYPIFVAHAGSTSGVIYNGPIRALPMIRFLETVLKPFTRIDTDEELWRFRAQHDAILLTSMNSTDPDFGPTFNMYRQMALRNLEADPFSQVGFGLFIRRELGEKFYLATGKTISLVLFNEIHTAKWIPPEKGMKGPIGQVAEWISERTSKPPITWSYNLRNGFANKVISIGSPDLSEEVMKRPVFLLVTRRYYPSAYSPFYAQLKEVSLDYFNCNKSVNITKLRRMTHKVNSEWMKLWNSLYKICQMSMSPSCEQIWEQLEHWNERKKDFVRESLKNYENVSDQIGFSGLSCRSARPFRFVAIDPVDVPHFTKLAFGVGPFGTHSSSTTNGTVREEDPKSSVLDPIAFIIDAQNELILPFNSFNISEIARVIHNFTLEAETGNKNFGTSQLKNAARSAPMSSGPIRTFTSTELTEFLAHSSQPLLLMYSAKFCGFCTVTLSHFVRLAHFLKNYNPDVVLGKIDTFQNSLPLDLTPERIPTFVFFPAHNRSESRLLSTSQPITAQVLLKFLLSEMDAATRIELSVQQISSPAEGLRRNRGNVMKRIETILATLTQDPTLSGFQGEETQTELLVDLTPRAVERWKYELLDHLRSMQLTLETQ